MTIGRIVPFLDSRTAIQTSDIQTFNSISLAKTASSSSSDPPSSEQIETPPLKPDPLSEQPLSAELESLLQEVSSRNAAFQVEESGEGQKSGLSSAGGSEFAEQIILGAPLKEIRSRATPAFKDNWHKIAAHLFGGDYIHNRSMGSVSLEGTNDALMALCLSVLLRSVQIRGEKQMGHKLAGKDLAQMQKLEKAFEDLRDLSAVFEVINERHLSKAASLPSTEESASTEQFTLSARLFAQWICYRINAMQVGEHLTISAGWKEHAMLYQIIRHSADAFTLSVYNTGAGLEFHPNMQEKCNTQQIQILSTNRISKERMLSLTLWQGHFEILKGKVKGEQRSQQLIYKWLTALDPCFSDKIKSDAQIAPMRRSQRAGTCTFEVLLLLTKEYLTQPGCSKDLYQEMRTQMRMVGLHCYEQYLIWNDLLPEIPEDSECTFSSIEQALQNQGVLEFLEQAIIQLRKEILRGIRKNRKQHYQLVDKNIEDIERCQARIDKRREEIHGLLKRLSHIGPDTSSVNLTIREVDPASPPKQASLLSIEPSVWGYETFWPIAAEITPVFNALFEKLNDKNTPAVEKYLIMTWVFKTMPSIDSVYWDQFKDSDYTKELVQNLQQLSSLYYLTIYRAKATFQADTHVFAMQKLLAILLKLTQDDPVIKGAYVDVEKLQLSGKEFSRGWLFPTDPITDQELIATEHFFKEYAQTTQSKIELFGYLEPFAKEEEATLEIDKIWWRDDPALKHIWENMDEAAKEHYEKGEGLDNPPYCLAQALISNTAGRSVSVGYAALQQHILNMLMLWYFPKRTISSGSSQQINQQTSIEREDGRRYAVRFTTQLPNTACYIDREIGKASLPKITEKELESLRERPQEEEVLCGTQTKPLDEQLLLSQDDHGHQLIKILLYYSRNSHLLNKPLEQLRLMSLMLEPGLLIAQLKNNPALLLYLASFIKRGYEACCPKSDSALFFLQLSAQVQTYAKAAGVCEHLLEQAELPSFLGHLRQFWQAAQQLKAEDREKRCLQLAIQALAYCARRAELQREYLVDLLQYHCFITRSKMKIQIPARLEEEMKIGRVVLALYLSNLPDKAVLAWVLGQFLGTKTLEEASIDMSKKPVIYILKGKYILDLIKGELIIDGRFRSNHIPKQFIECPEWGQLFPDTDRLTHITTSSTDVLEVTFQDHNQVQYRARKAKDEQLQLFRQMSDGSFCSYCDPKVNGLAEGMHFGTPWYDRKKKQVLFVDTLGEIRYIYSFENAQLVELDTGYIAVDTSSCDFLSQRLSAFDKGAQIWRDTKSSKGRIDLPSYGLALDIDHKGVIHAKGSLLGFHLAENQYVRSLAGFSSYLVFEHGSTGERRVLLPMKIPYFRKDFEKSLSFSDVPVVASEAHHLDYSTFVIQQGKKEDLYSSSLKDRLFLVMCYLAERNYAKAIELLQTQCRKLTAYDIEERAVLVAILAQESFFDESQLSSLVRLKVYALYLENTKLSEPYCPALKARELLRNQNSQFAKYKDRRLARDFERYLEQVFAIAYPMRLSTREAALLSLSLPVANKQVCIPAWVERPKKMTFIEALKALCLLTASTGRDEPVIEESLFSKGALTLYIDETIFKRYFLSLYALARSNSSDQAIQQERLSLEIWLSSCYSDDVNITCIIYFLRYLFKLPREKAQELPEPLQVLDIIKSDKHAEAREQQGLKGVWELAMGSIEKETQHVIQWAERPYKSRFNQEHELALQPQLAFAPVQKRGTVAVDPCLRRDLPLINQLDSLFTRLPEKESRPSLLVSALVEHTDNPFYVRSFEQLQASIQSQLQAEETTYWAISDRNLEKLEKILSEEIETHSKELYCMKCDLVRFANQVDTDARLQRQLQLQSGLLSCITISDLEFLYGAGGNIAAYQRANPSLDEQHIQILYDGTGQWLLLATQQQQRRRALKLVKKLQKAKDDENTRNLAERLYETLCAQRAFEIDKHPEMLVLEHRRNLRLRPSQVEHLESLISSQSDEIHEIIMGSGKSDILIPLFACKKASANTLPILVIPEEHIDTDAAKYQRYAAIFFGQKEIRVNWRDTSIKGLEVIESTLKDLHETQGFLAVSAKELHDFYLEEILAQRAYFKNPSHQGLIRVELFRKIREILQDKGHAIIDEVDAQLRCTFEVLKALDAPKQLDSLYRIITTACYDILTTHPSIIDNIYFEWFSKRGKEARPYIKERDTRLVIDVLAEELFKSASLSSFWAEFKEQEKAQIIRFLKAAETEVVELPAGLSDAAKNACCFAKKQLHFVLPNCIGKIYEQSYGLIPGKKGKNPSLLPVPWKAARCPQKRSEFASYEEQMAFTIQSYHKTGIPPLLLQEILLKYKADAQSEMHSNVMMKDIKMSKAYKQYAALLGEDILKDYPKLDTFTSEDIAQIARRIADNPVQLNYFIAEHILVKIVHHPMHVHSNGHTLAKMFKRVQGISGTVNKDRHTFHRRFQTHVDPTIVGKTLVCLSRGPEPIVLKDNGSKEQQLKNLLDASGQIAPLAIIDAGALFKDIPPRTIAQILLEFASKQTPEITAVVYFEGNKRLILKKGSPKPELYFPGADEDDPTDDPSRRITFYDQKHCTGTDIRQAMRARSLMSVNKETDLQQLLQAAWRMRGLDKEQRVTLVCSEEVAAIIANFTSSSKLTQAQLFAHAKHVEINKQLEDNHKSLLQQMHAEFVSTCQRLIDAILEKYDLEKSPQSFFFRSAALEKSPQKKQSVSKAERQLLIEALSPLNEMMIVRNEDSLFEQYGRAQQLIDAQIVLCNQVDQFVRKIQAWGSGKHGSFCEYIKNLATTAAEEYQKEMRELIETLTAAEKSIIHPKLPSQTHALEQMAIEVEQRKEQLVERVVEKEQTMSSTSQGRTCDLPLLPWKTETFASWQQEDAFTPLSVKIGDFYSLIQTYCLAAYQRREGEVTENEWIKNPFVTLTTALDLSNRESNLEDSLPGSIYDLFNPHLQISFNASCSKRGSYCFYGSQKSLEWALFIQDKQEPKNARLLLLSRKEAQECQRILQQERHLASVVPEEIRYNIALFSPRLHAISGEGGFYEEGRGEVDKSVLFTPATSPLLSDFEQLIVQAKFAMGETLLYSPKEEAYLLTWLSKLADYNQGKQLFVDGFLPGSSQKYTQSVIEATFEKLKHQATVEPALKEDIESSSESTSALDPLVPPSVLSGQQEQAQTPQLETPSNPVVPPVQQPLGLPIVLQTVIISPQEQWPDWRNIHRTERQRAKQECIDWMIAGWQERSLEKKALMKAFLYGQPDPSRVFEIAYSPHFQDLLNELAQSPAFSKW